MKCVRVVVASCFAGRLQGTYQRAGRLPAELPRTCRGVARELHDAKDCGDGWKKQLQVFSDPKFPPLRTSAGMPLAALVGREGALACCIHTRP